MTAQLYLFNNFSAMLGKKKVHLGNTTATMAGDVKRHKKKRTRNSACHRSFSILCRHFCVFLHHKSKPTRPTFQRAVMRLTGQRSLRVMHHLQFCPFAKHRFLSEQG